MGLMDSGKKDVKPASEVGESSYGNATIRGNLALSPLSSEPPAVERRRKARVRPVEVRTSRAPTLKDYEPLVGRAAIEELRFLAQPLKGKTVGIATSPGAGAESRESIARLITLLGELQIKARRDNPASDKTFNAAVHQLRQGLQDSARDFSEDARKVLLNKEYGANIALEQDFAVVDEGYVPALARERKRKSQRWIWKCDLDLSSPSPQAWNFLQAFTTRYDAAIFSAQRFAPQLKIPQYLFYSCIDPFSDINKTLDPGYIQRTCESYGIDRSRPVVTHITDFTRAEDHLGIIEAYRLAKKYADSQLILGGITNQAHAESTAVLGELRAITDNDPDIRVVELPGNLAINALQRASTIIVQKPARSGREDVVTAALWKARPTIASAVGGIPNQIIHRITGALVHSVEGFAFQIRYLLTHPDIAEQMGENGREHVKENFLITSDLKRWLLLFQIVSKASPL